MVLSSAAKDSLILTTFLLLVADRLLVLWALRFKALRIIAREAQGVERERSILTFFINEAATIAPSILLVTFFVVGLMQVTDSATISNEVGRFVFGAIAFMLSLFGTLLNGCMERIDLRAQR